MLTIRCNWVPRVLTTLYVMVAAMAPFVAGLMLWPVTISSGRTDPLIHLCVAGVLNFLFAICVLRHVRGAYAVFSAMGVEQYSPWCGWTRIPWLEVEKVTVYLNGFVII